MKHIQVLMSAYNGEKYLKEQIESIASFIILDSFIFMAILFQNKDSIILRAVITDQKRHFYPCLPKNALMYGSF